MSLSPYEMRNLLHHIMSGREFSIKKCQKYQSGYNIVSNNDRVSQVRLYFLSLLYDFFCFIQEVRNLFLTKRPDLSLQHFVQSCRISASKHYDQNRKNVSKNYDGFCRPRRKSHVFS